MPEPSLIKSGLPYGLAAGPVGWLKLTLAIALTGSLTAEPHAFRRSVPTPAKVRLGAQLFFDPRLSVDGSLSCASCHDPAQAWANHQRTDTGVLGRIGARNSGTILNAARMTHQFWDGRAESLEAQVWGPIVNALEMGETEAHVLQKLGAIPGYRRAFRRAFRAGLTRETVAQALAAFERTVVSGPSPYERFNRGDHRALNPSARRGLQVFEGKAGCFRCHSGSALSNQGFANLGVGLTSTPSDLGREAVTGNPEDRGRFRTPGLLNVALTWPYFHDGSAATLEAVIEVYDQGGIANENLDPRLRPLGLSASEKRDLKTFLEALTGALPAIRPPKLPR